MAIPAPILKPDFNITRASHVVFQVKDLSASKAFYVDTLGFLVSDETPDALYLRGLEEACHHSLVLKKASLATCERAGFRVLTEDDLDLVRTYFQAAGLPAEFVDVPFQGRTLHTTDPSGALVEFCVSMDTRPRSINRFENFVGACPQRLDHVQIITGQIQATLEFYMGMGFRLSEYVVLKGGEPGFIFLQRKGNPHDVVFGFGSGPRLHHVAFTAPEVSHLMHVCDLLAVHGFGRNVEFGPGRHYGPGYARYLYLRDPDGHRLELFNQHYQTIDAEEEPVRWTLDEIARLGWGPPPPQSWQEEASPFTGAPVATVDPRLKPVVQRA